MIYKFAQIHDNDGKARRKHAKMQRRLLKGQDLSKTKWLQRAIRRKFV